MLPAMLLLSDTVRLCDVREEPHRSSIVEPGVEALFEASTASSFGVSIVGVVLSTFHDLGDPLDSCMADTGVGRVEVVLAV